MSVPELHARGSRYVHFDTKTDNGEGVLEEIRIEKQEGKGVFERNMTGRVAPAPTRRSAQWVEDRAGDDRIHVCVVLIVQRRASYFHCPSSLLRRKVQQLMTYGKTASASRAKATQVMSAVVSGRGEHNSRRLGSTHIKRAQR